MLCAISEKLFLLILKEIVLQADNYFHFQKFACFLNKILLQQDKDELLSFN